MKIALKILGIAALFGGLFVFGYSWRDIQSRRAPSLETLGGLVGYQRAQPKVAPVKVFRNAYVHIEQDFAGPVDASKLKYAGLGGMMASLGDPHTLFMEPKLASEFRLETKAQFAGVGASLRPDPLGARVGIVFEEGPAMRAGLKPSDLITAVDGKSVNGQDIDTIVSKIRGPEGTKVTLTLIRANMTQPILMTIRRAKVITPTVMSRMLDDQVGYINITIFGEPTANQFERAFDKLDHEGMKGLVLDLRGNPGGLLDSVRDILSLFIENKPAVTLKMRGGAEERTVTLVGKKRKIDFPVVTLVNEDSASAAEIMSGVLRDYRMTTLVGEHTYGKASVQNVIPFRDGSSAKITIARYYLPSGDDIGRKVDEDGVYVSGGIKVDEEVKLNDEPTTIFGDPKTDNQLARAIEIVKSRSQRKSVSRLPATAELPLGDPWRIV